MPIGFLIAGVKGVFRLKAALDGIKAVTPLDIEVRKFLESREKRRTTGASASDIDSGGVPITDQLNKIRGRLEHVETDTDKQAEVIAAIAAQTEALSQGVQVLAGRVTALLVVTAAAGAAVIVALGVSALVFV